MWGVWLSSIATGCHEWPMLSLISLAPNVSKCMPSCMKGMGGLMAEGPGDIADEPALISCMSKCNKADWDLKPPPMKA